MKKRGLTFTAFFAVFVVLLAAALAAFYFLLQNHVIINKKLYSKDASVMNLKGQALTFEDYNALAWRLPQADILWDVPFQGEPHSSDLQELTITRLSSEDIPLLHYFPNLTTVHAENCEDYPALLELVRKRPDLTVNYSVPISGQQVSMDTTSITVTTLSLDDAVMLNYLPRLTSIDGTRCRDYAVMRQVEKDHPDWQVSYTRTLAGRPISVDAAALEVTGVSYDELYYALPAMANLKTVTIHTPKADSTQLGKLQQDYPQLDIRWDVEYYGVTFYSDAEEVDISFFPLDSVETAKDFASKFPKLKKLIVESGDVTDDEMAVYRDEVRSSYKVVWTVYFSPLCKARTDEIYFMPIQQGEYYFEERNVYPLRFCEDMICIDIGHSTVATIDFAAYMPHLKYLILAWTQVTDLTPISNCKELVYLEIDHGIVHDFTPLLGCTALEDININDQQWHPSIDPIYEMTWLKTLWAPDRPYNQKQKLIESLPNTRVVTQEYSSRTGQGWRNLKNYYDMRDILGMPYMY